MLQKLKKKLEELSRHLLGSSPERVWVVLGVFLVPPLAGDSEAGRNMAIIVFFYFVIGRDVCVWVLYACYVVTVGGFVFGEHAELLSSVL